MSGTGFQRSGALGLGTRLALTMLGAMVAIQALNSAVFVLLPRPDFKIFSARWIVAETDKVMRALAQSPAADEVAVAEHFRAETGLVLGPPPPRVGDEQRLEFGALERLQDSLEVALAGITRDVKVRSFLGPPDARPVMVPPGFEPSIPRGPLTATEPDLPVWGRFDIIVEMLDGRRFMISQPRPGRIGPLALPTLVTVGGAILLISLLSAWTAKRALGPLDELVAAARRIGSERVPTPIATDRMRDFAAIGDAMNEMQARIRGFVDERTQILAAISHDLKTALTRLRLDAEGVSDAPVQQRLVSAIEEMDSMISATLTFAGDDLKGERSEALDVASLLITIVDNFEDMGARVSYAGPDHVPIIGQPTALRRVFTNLVDNAIKYGGSAEIILAVAGDAISIDLADRGPGIPPEQVEAAFKPFSRLEQSRSRETGGVGLGLTIARDIVRAHGGTLTLANRPEGGLVATVRLPTA